MTRKIQIMMIWPAMGKKHLLTALLAALAGLCLGSPTARATDSDTHMWMPITLEIPMSQRWSASMEVQPRLTDDLGRLSTMRVRPSLIYKATPHLNLQAGYFWSPDFKRHTEEQRIWEQMVYTKPLKKAQLTHQVRLEQRFQENASSTLWRGRYMLRMLYPIGKKGWYWVGSNEVMMNFNSNNQTESGFDQNRTFTGLRKKLAANTFIEGGYTLVYVNQPYGGTDQLNHVLVLRLTMNTGDFSPDEPDELPRPYIDSGID